jgi:hypothetical protein
VACRSKSSELANLTSWSYVLLLTVSPEAAEVSMPAPTELLPLSSGHLWPAERRWWSPVSLGAPA